MVYRAFPTFVIPFQFDLELLEAGVRQGVAEEATIDGYLRYASPLPAEIPENLVAQTE